MDNKVITHIPRNPSDITVVGNLCDFVAYPVTKIGSEELVCLYYNGIRRGSYKKVYIGLIDEHGRKFISTDEPVLQKCKGRLRDDCIKYRFEAIRKEVILHMKVFSKYPKLVPRIISVNIYLGNEYRIQTLMDDVNTNGYLILKEYNLLSNVTKPYRPNYKLEPYHKDIARCIFKAIKPIHRMGIVHGDLKSDNFAIKGLNASEKIDDITLTDCDVRVIDFGLSNELKELKLRLKEHCDYLRTMDVYIGSYGYVRESLDMILDDISRDKPIQEYEFYTPVGRHVKNLFLIGITWPNGGHIYTYWDELFYSKSDNFEELVRNYVESIYPTKKNIVQEYLGCY